MLNDEDYVLAEKLRDSDIATFLNLAIRLSHFKDDNQFNQKIVRIIELFIMN